VSAHAAATTNAVPNANAETYAHAMSDTNTKADAVPYADAEAMPDTHADTMRSLRP